MDKNKYSKNLNKYEQLYFLIEDYAKEYANLLEDKDNRTNENRCERYYKKVYDFIKKELDKAREEGNEELSEAMIKYLENMIVLVGAFNPMSEVIKARQEGELEAYKGILSKLKQ